MGSFSSSPIDIINTIHRDYLNHVDRAIVCSVHSSIVVNLPRRSQSSLILTSEVARIGHLSLLLWLIDNGHQWHSDIMTAAVSGNQLQLILDIYDRCPINIEECYKIACENNSTLVLEWLLTNYNDKCPIRECMIAAMIPGHLDLLQLLSSQPLFADQLLIDSIIRNPNPSAWHLVDLPAYYGHEHILRWLSSSYSYVEFDRGTLYTAIEGGQLELAKWLYHDCNCKVSRKHVMDAAIKSGIHMIQWLREIGVNYHSNVCQYATQLGKLDILKYIIEDGAQFDREECLRVAEKWNQDCVVAYLQSLHHY